MLIRSILLKFATSMLSQVVGRRGLIVLLFLTLLSKDCLPFLLAKSFINLLCGKGDLVEDLVYKMAVNASR